MTSVDDMTQIMIVILQLYSCLSLLARQSMSMLTELPGMITVLEQFFHLEYSDSTILVTSNTLGTELELIYFNGGNYWCWYLQH